MRLAVVTIAIALCVALAGCTSLEDFFNVLGFDVCNGGANQGLHCASDADCPESTCGPR